MTKLLTIAMVTTFAFVSCKKSSSVSPATPKTTSAIAVPAGFNWANSRNLSFVINVSDALFPGATHIVSIYDGNPEAGGKLLTKGAATATGAYKGKIYLSNQLTSIFIVSTAPDNTSVTKTVTVGSADVNVAIVN